MSVQFGRWNLDGTPVDQSYLEKVKPVIAPYGPDEGRSYARTGISILYRAFHTTKESRRETQPHTTESGEVITWDGRLDNRAELISQLRDVLTISSTDVSIVAAAYEKWGTNCFAKLIGDWALSIWDANSRSLILAKDPIGTRHLYYSIEKDQVTWSTILDPLVLFAGKTFALCEEYIAGCFSFFPATHLTPYVGIQSVPPSSFVAIRAGKHTVSKYWDFDPAKRIRYRTDGEYEEHFRTVFAEAVRRRLRSDSPILAELSGGMDSSSIVCMADTIIARGAGETPRLDTISYYDDSEPNWNERPYFTKVEEKRGRVGWHIDADKQEPLKFELDSDYFVATPASSGENPSETSRQFAERMASQGNRVILSGIGGDEVTGGVPIPSPELADLLTTGRLKRLAHQLKAWSLNKRKPWFHLFFDAIRGFLPTALVGIHQHKRPAPWLKSDFAERNEAALLGYECRIKIFASLPSFQDNLSTLNGLKRQLAYFVTPSRPLLEKRFPYLDRGLLEFLYAIPVDQLLRPGQRRSLMRRSLAEIVPNEILERKRKAFVSRAPILFLSSELQAFNAISHDMISTSLGIIDPDKLRDDVEKASKGNQVPLARLLATFGIERWLRHIHRRIDFGNIARSGCLSMRSEQTTHDPYELKTAT